MAPLHSISRRRLLQGLVTTAAASGLGTRASAEDEGNGQLLQVETGTVQATPIPHFERSNPSQIRFGELDYRGGVALRSSSSHFGGLSGLVIEPDGSGLLAVTDVGGWVSADITYDRDRPSGLANMRLGPLRDAEGQPLTLRDKRQQDAESIALLEGTLAKGTVLVGFERNHRIVRYPVAARQLGTASQPLALPPDVKRIPKNQGFEAVTVLKGGPHKGAVVAFAERYTRGSGYHSGWLWLAGEPQKFQVKDIDVFDVTDVTSLDNGDLLLLERRFRWTEGVQMRLRRLPAAEIVPGARITGTTLLQVNGDFQIDNMEGVAVHRDAKGQTVVTLISDDNFNHFLQRTLLLQFTLLSAPKAAVPT